ncbi:MAG: hypothetical protein M3517_06360 [Actinomycetota bacterium]|nr:hypothetical protein [Actinomycetota bacterium]
MSSLPPPRLPGQPPDRPPIRRPDDHLPRPGEYAFNQASPPSEPPRRRTGLLVAAIACVVVLGAAATVVVVGRDGNEALDTEAASERLDDEIRQSDGDLDDCPVDEFRDVLAGAIEPVDNDELFDTIDLGEESVELNDPGDAGDASTILCDVEVPSDSGERTVSLALSPEGDKLVEVVGDIDGVELEEVGEFRGGTFTLVTYDADTDFVTIIWTDEHLGVGLAVGVSDAPDVDQDALREGFEAAIPGIVEQLAGD